MKKCIKKGGCSNSVVVLGTIILLIVMSFLISKCVEYRNERIKQNHLKRMELRKKSLKKYD